jgi:hypothetical protein
MRVTNGIPLGRSTFLPVHTVNCVQPLKEVEREDILFQLWSNPASSYWQEWLSASQRGADARCLSLHHGFCLVALLEGTCGIEHEELNTKN